ncbi:glycosyltransferase [Sulfolobus acidocaldarius]|uniref:Conserved Archaeal membrane protein n=4 Tax=Sulfolobus acidocaldarius TaxID=2285 RepID=Q4JC59_SULAC|nr:glycosyltransferase family 2 protein [Sulfolobus acidocaldarius]AAY79620.1 conserved Archaeal membrane protein [Sulfolobus acidocaldarius DSM 639]AGE70174.1 hypothetical protein SacN8_00965 [Sulfolobus acidocaldarius N8]AGE72449.1 hypothetical protein SacRon12I_00965 [Sulfolobus acidocaldarius Ron12/I]ALU29416.1 glycosyl transferase family 2 [Sulfolobus acidocaldarius]ALU32144.1 glycosyl transferase family 2 [Sulfolobus acidocaldarius]
MLIFLISSAIVLLADLLITYQIYREIKVRREVSGNQGGFASVIIPVRGLDVNAEENLKSLLSQDYSAYEVIYVVDDENDPIVPILRKYNVKVVVSNKNCDICSGKINAQLEGLKHARGDIIVFADSDTWFPKYWLKELVSPLSNYVATTVFSWAKPVRLTIGNIIRAGFWTLGFESQAVGGTFLWGGSMAFKREFFDERVIQELKTQWCDDCTLTRIAKERGKLGFVFNAMPLNFYDETQLITWSKRQLITVWRYSRRGVNGFIIVAIFMLAFLFLIPFNVFAITPFIFWVFKNILRSYKIGLSNSIIPSLASILAIFYSLFLIALTLREKNIIWRGKIYKV